MLTCREVVTLATDYADARLPWPARLQMRLHLAMCAICRRYLEQLALTTSLLRRLGTTLDRTEIPPSLREAFKHRSTE